MKVCKNCNEIVEDSEVLCKNCLNTTFENYDDYKNYSLNQIRKNDTKKTILKILFWIIYFSILILSLFISYKNNKLDFNLIFLTILLFIFSFVSIVFTEELCKLRYIFVIDSDSINISEIYLYFIKFLGFATYIYLIFNLLK